MKNYSNNSENFILNYKIVNNEIIVNFSCIRGKDRYSVPYTIENEKKILEKMKKQVSNISKCNTYNYEKFLKVEKKLKFGFVFLGLSALFVLPYIFGIVDLTNYLNVSLDSVLIMFNLYKFVSSATEYMDFKTKSRDLAKNNLFIENEACLNKALKSNKSILSGTNVKEKDLTLGDNEISFNINNIDKIKLKELKQIIENSKFENDLNFDYSNYKVLTKKIK